MYLKSCDTGIMFWLQRKLFFIKGFFLGLVISVLLSIFEQKTSILQVSHLDKNYLQSPFNSAYKAWFMNNSLKRSKVSEDNLRYSTHKYLTEAQYLYGKVKIMCLILVHKVEYASAANNTWVRNCNNVTFVNLTVQRKSKLPTKKTKEESRWTYLCQALISVSTHVFDWILVVNDTTFVIVENLRYLVAGLDQLKPYYLGHGILFWGGKYNSAQAGYILSRASVNVFKNKFNSSHMCIAESSLSNQEDVYLGKTLASFNIHPVDTRDRKGLATFHGFNFQKLFNPGSTSLSIYYKFSIYPTVCCSIKSVTFQVAKSEQMYTYQYLLYQLQIFTYGNLGNSIPTTPVPDEKVWQSFLGERGIMNMNITINEYYKLWDDMFHGPMLLADELQQHTHVDVSERT